MTEGQLPVAYAAVSLDAAPGAFVLAPPRRTLDRVWAGEADSVVFHAATLEAVGPVTSSVRASAGLEVVPNSVVLTFPARAEVAPGALVRGPWVLGAGLQRAVVVGGEPTAPRVRYLDVLHGSSLDLEGGWAAGQFAPIVAAGDVGASLACGSPAEHAVIVGQAGGRWLAVGFAGRLRSFAEAECRALEPRPTVSVGATVWAPRLGRYEAAAVERVDEAFGRVWVRRTVGDEALTEAVAWLDVATSDPAAR